MAFSLRLVVHAYDLKNDECGTKSCGDWPATLDPSTNNPVCAPTYNIKTAQGTDNPLAHNQYGDGDGRWEMGGEGNMDNTVGRH